MNIELRLASLRYLSLLAALGTLAAACDLEDKSVSGTASADGGGGDGNGSTGADGGDDGNTGSLPNDDGGSAGSDGGSDPGPSACIEIETPLSPDEVSPLGFAPDDVIAFGNGWSTEIEWLTDDGFVDVVPAGTTGPIDLGLTYLGGAIVYIESEPNPDYPDDGLDDGLDECTDRLEIDMEIIVHTADGRLDEQFVATLTAVDATALSLYQTFGPSGFSGTFSEDEVTFPDDNGEVNGFVISGTYTQDMPWTGSLGIEITGWLPGEDPDSGWIGFGPIAVWPSNSRGE